MNNKQNKTNELELSLVPVEIGHKRPGSQQTRVAEIRGSAFLDAAPVVKERPVSKRGNCQSFTF